jgi:ABC-type transport system involved in multi-copper enzyme maturation permease subunit
MWTGISALLARAMQMDARQVRTHLFRLAFVVFIYGSLVIAQAQAISRGAPGLYFLSGIVFLNAVFITLAGVSFFSSAITEEKEENTLGLLQMAGIGPTSVLLGKSTSRLIQALMLLLVQFPFTLLSITLGGVTMQQVFAAYAALLAYLIGLANVALFWSVICRRTGNAAGLTSLCLVLYFLAPEFARGLQGWLTSIGWSSARWHEAAVMRSLDVISEWEVYRRLAKIMVTGFSESIVSAQVASNMLFGAICFGMARLLFEPFTADVHQLTDTRGLVLRPGSRMPFFSAGRSWENPFIWKDFHFLAGGYPGLIVKWFAYAGLLGLIAGISYYSSYPYPARIEWQEVIGGFAVAVVSFLILEASLYAARVFHDEIRQQTMSALLMLPRSIPYIGYSKTAGCLLGLLPGVFWLLFCGVVAVASGWTPQPHQSRNGFIADVVLFPGLWGVFLAVNLFLHLTTLLSLFVKWGALPLAFLIMIMLTWCCPVFSVIAMFIATAMDSGSAQLAASGILILINVVASFVLQMMIGARLQEISST